MLSTKCVEKSWIWYMYEKDLALNNLQWSICHKTKPNWLQVIVPVRFPSMGQMDQFQNYSFSVGAYRKTTQKKQLIPHHTKVWIWTYSDCNSLTSIS